MVVGGVLMLAAPDRRSPAGDVRARRGSVRFARDVDGMSIASLQRARIMAAAVEVTAEQGAASVSVAHLVGRSGISRRTFYEVFSDRDDCLLAAFEDVLGRVAERVLAACEGEHGWSERIRVGLGALLGFLDEQPSAARLLLVESLAIGGVTLASRERVVARLVCAVDAGRGESKAGANAPPLTAEGVVGGVLSILARQVGGGRSEPGGRSETLAGLLNPLMGIVVTPYLGFAACARELRRPIQPRMVERRASEPLVDPFKPAGMRLTYRTVRVLMAVGENAGASNRLIGDLAEMRDQGQISKLLGRLARLGLIENSPPRGPAQGAPNAWRLTGTGRAMADSLRAHSERLEREQDGEARVG